MLKKLIDRPVAVTMGLLVIMVLGAVSMRLLPISLIPDIEVPDITVRISANDMSSREIDETLLRPLRQNLVQTSYVEDICCEAMDGSGVINMSFSENADMDYVFIEVNEKIDRSMDYFGDVGRPKVIRTSASDIPAFYMNLTLKEHGDDRMGCSPASVSDDFSRLSLFASEVIAKRIEQLPEVAMVDMSGCVSQEILIIPNETALVQAGLNINDFEAAVRAANVRLGNLIVRDGEYRYSVKFQSFVADKSEIENIFLDCNGRIFRLKDLASVKEHPSKRTGLIRSDGKAAVSLAIIKQSDAKMSSLRSSMSTLSLNMQQDYPDIEFEMTRDQTELLEYSINNLIQNIVLGIILACIVIFLFMQDFRSPVLVALTIPSALVFSMLVFYLAGLSINIISLSGLILGVGMMVDNTIILTDNITARWQRGDTLRTAVLSGTSEVVAPMLSSVLTTCAVFVPLIFLSGTAGVMFYEQAIAIVIVLMTSYVVTISVIPVYYRWMYHRLPSFRPNLFLVRFDFSHMNGLYETILKWLFRHRWVVWAIFGLSTAGIVFLLVFLPKSKLPEMTYTDMLLNVNWNVPLSLEHNTSRVIQLEETAGENLQQITSLVGEQQFVIAGSPKDMDISSAAIYIKCCNASDLEIVRKRLSSAISERWPDAAFSFEPSGNIFDVIFSETDAELVTKFRPVSSTRVEVFSLGRLMEDIHNAVPDIVIPAPDLKLDVLYVADPERMLLYGISYENLLRVLRNSLNENELFSIVQGNRRIPVVMGVDRSEISKMMEHGFISANGIEVPLSYLMRQTWEQDFKKIISGADGVYYPLELDIDRRNVPIVIDKIRSTVAQNGDFNVDFDGAYFTDIEMMKEMLIVLLVSIILLYLILASQFESMIQPLIILSELVIDIFFALVVLWICGVTINLMSLIGLVVVCGIVINDSILKIDTINRLRGNGYGIEHSIMVAGHRRFKAIIMTSLTTILSVCPFLARGSMGDDLQYPMSLVIIAGMTAGTLISLFFVPVLYYEVYKKRK